MEVRFTWLYAITSRHTNITLAGVDQTTSQSFDDNGESDLDLEYAFALTNPQPITLIQTGDLVEGK